MLSNTRSNIRRLYLAFTKAIIPLSNGCTFLVVLGGNNYIRTLRSGSSVSFLACAEQFSINNNTFRPSVLPMNLSILINYTWNSEVFIHTFLFVWHSNPSSCPYVFLNNLGFNSFPITINCIFSDPSPFQQARNVMRVFSFLFPETTPFYSVQAGG